MSKRLSFRSMLFFSILAISLSCEEYDEKIDGEFTDGTLDDRAIGGDIYQAEDRSGASDCIERSNHAGFTGSGFMDFGGNGTWIEWNNVTVAAAGEYGLTFRYANGSAGNRQAAAIINGKNVGNVAFSPTGGWPNWKTASVKATLRKGTNTIRVQANTGRGGPNLDKMDITISDLCPDDPGKTQPGECGCGVPEGSCGNDKNVARGKPTRQSSTAYRGESSRAVDGNTSGVYGHNSITHTAHTTAPWWIVDLGTSHQISGVTLWNRTDCCSNRLSNFHVDYLDRAGNVIAKKDYPGQVGIRAEIGLSASGVYSVRVQLHGTNPLSLAEVEVQGTAGGGGTSRCAEATEHKSATLSCGSGETIDSIDFASYGLPTGSCQSGFDKGSCHASSSESKVETACLNKQSCTVSAGNGTFGDPCSGKSKRLAVVYTCSGGGGGDQCPNDPDKTEPGKCGCGRPESECGTPYVQLKDFTKLSRTQDTKTKFSNVDARYMIYVESWGRNGHNNISMTQNTHKCPTIEGAELVNVGGGQDKFIALYKINRLNIVLHNTGGSAQALFLKTDHNVTLDAKSVDPAVGAERIKGPKNENQILIYAEDEGGKGSRDEFFMPKAMECYGSGDDLLYLFGYGDLSSTNKEGPNGNGAVGTLTFL